MIVQKITTINESLRVAERGIHPPFYQNLAGSPISDRAGSGFTLNTFLRFSKVIYMTVICNSYDGFEYTGSTKVAHGFKTQIFCEMMHLDALTDTVSSAFWDDINITIEAYANFTGTSFTIPILIYEILKK